MVRPGEPLSAIEVRNTADAPITDLRIGICGQTFGFGPDYGHDRLDGANIPPGGSRQFPASPGCYNIAAMTSTGAIFGRTREYFDVVVVTANAPAVWTVP